MKIAIVIYSNIFSKIDGLTNYYKQLWRYARRNDLQVDYFLQDLKARKRIVRTSVRCFFFPIQSARQFFPRSYISFNPLMYLRLLRFFHYRFQSEHYDAVQITSAHPFCLAGVLVAKRVGIPIVGAYHTRVPEYARYWARRRWADRWYGSILVRLVYIAVALWTRMIYAVADVLLAPTRSMRLQL